MNFPLIDYHVHLTEQFTIEMAVKLSGELNVKFGIVEHPGPHTGIQSDDDLVKYIENFKKNILYILVCSRCIGIGRLDFPKMSYINSILS